MKILPNRIIKESICYSDDIDKLTSFEETVFYRLLVRVDDYGRIDARASFLKSMLFVTKKGITEKNIEDAVAKLASVGLVQVYEVTGKPFLLFPKWSLHQRIRTSRPKYPGPQQQDEEINSRQIAANGGEPPPESESESEYIFPATADALDGDTVEKTNSETCDSNFAENKKPNVSGKNSNVIGLDGDEMFEKIYNLYPKKKGKSDGKSAFMNYLTSGRKLKGQGNVRFNHLQIGYAVLHYAGEVELKEEEFIKDFGTFMGSQNGKHPIIDYVENSKEEYEAGMLKKYGADWRKVKFQYAFGGVNEADDAR